MKSNKIFECKDVRCLIDGNPRMFSRAALFRQHQLKVHAEKNLKCRHCPKTFSVSYLLKQHENQCNRTLNCDHCGAKFRHQSSFRRHQRSSKHGLPGPDQTATKARGGVVFNIMPLQLVPILLVSKEPPQPVVRADVKTKSAKTTTYRAIRPKSTPTLQNAATSKESTAVQTSIEDQLAPGSSIATQTVTNQCNVAVGIDDVFEDLEKLFAQAETQTQSFNSEQNVQHAETQTHQPSFADSDMQTNYDKLSDFLPMSAETLANVAQVERILASGVEVQTSFEPQMQHFGMQTVFPHDSKIAGTQTLSVSLYDGQCQTGMELSSVETQTIEQFLNDLENTP